MSSLAELCSGRLGPAHAEESDHVRASRLLKSAIDVTMADLKRSITKLHQPAACRAGAILGRRLIEQCTLALLGRLDPIRLVTAFKGPMASDFRIGERNESSFSWAKDVLPEFSVASGSWSQASLKKGTVRGLLDGHLATFLFESAHGLAVDSLVNRYLHDVAVPSWPLEIQKFDSGVPLLSQLRTRAATAYSSLSKGVHFEFLGPGNTELSTSDLATSLDSALFAVSTTAFYSHLCGISINSLSAVTAVNRFADVAAYADVHIKPKTLKK